MKDSEEILLMSSVNHLLLPLAFIAATDVYGEGSVTRGALQSEQTFRGQIGADVKQSVSDWPKPISAPEGAPNIVLILLDDIGFADTSTFGGPAQTPELSKLAAGGLRYNNFNTTAMCSPTRAALLTGRNHHRVGFGIVNNHAGGYPGYNSVWKDSTASIAEVLRQHGYSTSAFGKWHNTPDWEITSTGPFDRWPTGRGFEYFYGFMNAYENQWEPATLYRNTIPVDAPATPQQGYHITTDIANEAIRWVAGHKVRAPEKPYFLYFATGAVHFPHHAPREWIDRYRGEFDSGWDRLRVEIFERQKRLGVIPKTTELTPRPAEIPAWDSLSADQRRLYARQMEVYAGFVAHTDYEIGRLLQEVRSGPGSNNTLVLYVVGDNGAAGGGVEGETDVTGQLELLDELGGPEASPSSMYVGGWGWAGNTPFQYWKGVASHFGGVRDPLVVSWPAKIKEAGGLRDQFTHVTDVAATLYEVTGISLPGSVNGVAQQPLDGVSFARTFNDAQAPSAHRTQYFEMLGNRALYHDGWVAAARHPTPQEWLSTADTDTDYSKDRWELYHVSEDFSEVHDLALRRPDKLRELQALFDREAKENDVYPLGGAFGGTYDPKRPSSTEGRREFVYLPSERRIAWPDVPRFGDVSYRVSAQVVIPESGAQGVLLSFGDRHNGFVWYVQDNHLVYENHQGARVDKIISNTPLMTGEIDLAYEFSRNSMASSHESPWEPVEGIARLYINEALAGEKKLRMVRLGSWTGAPLYVGNAAGPTVSTAFDKPFPFTGVLTKMTIQLR